MSDTLVMEDAPSDGGGGSEPPVLDCRALDVGYGKLTVARDITFSLSAEEGADHPGPQRCRQNDAVDDPGGVPVPPVGHHHDERACREGFVGPAR